MKLGEVKKKILAKLYILVIVMVIAVLAWLLVLYANYMSLLDSDPPVFEGEILADTPQVTVAIGVFDAITGEKVEVAFNSSWWNYVDCWEKGEHRTWHQMVEGKSEQNPRKVLIPRPEAMYCVLELPGEFYMFFDETKEHNPLVTYCGYTDLDNNSVFDYTLIVDFNAVIDSKSPIPIGIFVATEATQ